MDKTRILFVAAQIGNRSDGGLESATRIFEALAADFDWTFVTTHATWFNRRWSAGRAAVTVCPVDERAGPVVKAGEMLAWFLRTAWLALVRRPQVIHANDARAFRVVSLLARVLRIPVLLTVRDIKPESEPYGRHWLTAARQCALVVTLSAEMGRAVRDRIGVPESRLRIINSIVDLGSFRLPAAGEREASRRALGLAADEFAVGCVGAIRAKKGQLDLLEHVIPRVAIRVPGLKVHFFGDFDPGNDEYSALCAAAVERRGLSDVVRFHGHRDDMATAFRALDVIVIGSRYEGLARCMIEGMASGLPVVSLAVPSAREMLEANDAGVVVEQGDFQQLTGVLAELARQPERRAVMGLNGRRTAEVRFDSAAVGAAWRDVYRSFA